MRSARLVAGVVAQRQELLDVGVPRLEIDAGGPLALAPLIDRRHRGVQRLEPGDDAVRLAVGPLDERAARPDAVVREADAARELREQRHVGVPLVDRLQMIGGRIEQEAARELLVPRPRVEHRRRARQVLQRREQLVQLQRLAHRLRQRAGDPQKKLLRRLDDQPRLRMLQQIAVVDGAQPEVLELAIALDGDGVVQLARVVGHEGAQALVHQAQAPRHRHRLRKGVDLLPAHLLVDVGGEQPRRQLGVLRLLDDEAGGRLDRQLVELARRRPVVKAADRLGGDAQRVDVGETDAGAADRADDLVDVHRLERAAALADPHAGLRRGLLTRRRRAPAVAAHDLDRRRHRHGLLLALWWTVVRPRELEAGRAQARAQNPGEPSDRPFAPAGYRSNRRRISPGVGCWQVFGLASASGGSPVFLPRRFPARRPVLVAGSFSLTAAGQPRIFTEFPLSRGGCPSTSTKRNIL